MTIRLPKVLFTFYLKTFAVTIFFLIYILNTTALAADGFNKVGIQAALKGMQLNINWDSVPSSVTSNVTGQGQIVRPFEGYNVGIEVRPGWFSPPVVVDGCGVSPGYSAPCGSSMTIDLTEIFMQGKLMQGFVVRVSLSAMYGPKDIGLGEFFSGNLFQQLSSPPITMIAGGGDGQRGQILETLDPFVVQLQRAGLPLTPENDYNFKSSLVIWRIISKPVGAFGGVLSSWESIFYDGAGQASITYSLGNLEGEYKISGFCSVCNNGAGAEVIYTAYAENTLKLEKVTESDLTGAAGETISQPLTVQVKDAEGKGREGIGISYRIISQPDGAVAASPQNVTKKTGADGKASARVTLGDKVGTYTVEVTCPKCTEGSPLTFKARVVGPEGCTGNGASIASQVNFASGNLFYTKNLLALTGTGPQVGFTLAFNSLDVANGPLGLHWTHTYNMQITRDSEGFITLKEEDGRRVVFAEGSPGSFVPIDHFGRPGITIDKLPDSTYRLNRRDGSRYLFRTDGKLSGIEDRYGSRLSMGYESERLVALIDEAGRITSVGYDAQGRLSSLTDPAGRVAQITYDGAGMLYQIFEFSGEQTVFLYDVTGQLVQRIEADGSRIDLSYDTEGRLVSAVDASGLPVTVSYQPEINQAILTDRDGGMTSYRYDLLLDAPIQIVAPDGGMTSNQYDTQGNLLLTTDADGNTTSYTYDDRGNMTSVADADGHLTQYTYDSLFNQVTSITDPQGNVTANAYDARGNLVSTTDPGGGVTSYAYNIRGELSSLTDPQGRISTFIYDAAGNLIQTTDPTGAVTKMTYDAVGNLISRTDASGETTTFQYDANSRLLKVTDPLGNITGYTYDAKGNRTSQTDALGRTTQYRYNYLDKLTQVTDPAGGITVYTYDTKGNHTGITDARGNTTTYSYDAKNRLTSETDALGNTITYGYDARDNLILKTDGKAQTITYQYDAQNRLTQKAYPDNTTETYTYDISGRILTAANAQIGYTFTYDASGRTTSVTDTRGHTVSYTYDTSGRRTRLTYPDGKEADYAYDAAGRLSMLSNWQGGATTFTYDALGRRKKMAHPNGTESHYSYDVAGRLTDLRHQTSRSTVFDQYTYTHDAIGNRLKITGPDEQQGYTYDMLDRLTAATPTKRTGKDKEMPHKAEVFTYDPVGNRKAGPESQDLYVYNPGNQLTEDRKYQYSYDRNGNILQKSGIGDNAPIHWSYTYDFEHRLMKVVKQDTDEIKTVSFQYDPFGRRIEKRVEAFKADGAAIKIYTYIYDNEDMIVQTLDKAEGEKHKPEITHYLHGPGIDEPLMADTKHGPFYYHADGLGSIVALTDNRGKGVERYRYSSFGVLKRHGGKVKNPYTFTGREWDEETGLYFYRARYYDPAAGRFLSFDPILRGVEHTEANSCNKSINSLPLNSPQELNPYIYVLNNPTNLDDPFGKSPWYGNYCGPGGSGTAQNCIDSACKKHDECYSDCGVDARTRWEFNNILSKCAFECDKKLLKEAIDCSMCQRK